MPDREKVIKGLECHQHPFGCNECPYWDKSQPLRDCEVDQLSADALALLKEQEAVKPHWRCSTVYMNGTGKIDLICGNCGISISLGKPNYCPWCGRKVKWDD